MLDFARLFPPEPPVAEFKASFLVRLLRVELVRAQPTPLCSDAFSFFQKDDSNRAANNTAVRAAVLHLLQTVIPQLVNNIETDQLKIDQNDLVEQMHQRGA